MKPRDYQADLIARTHAAWDSGAKNVLDVQATRTGKTVIFASIMAAFGAPAIAIAHREELVSQMSRALAKCGVVHRIIAPKEAITRIVRRHVEDTGRSFYSPSAPHGVASVDTLVRRAGVLDAWIKTIRLWVVDEAHHVTGDNKWAKAVSLFPNAKGLGVTATATRADGKGLGSHSGGVFDTLIEGMQAREAIREGWLLGHKIYAPPSDYQRPDTDNLGSKGDFKQQDITNSIRKSHIVGDIVDTYCRFVKGKTAVVFSDSVETGTDMAARFNAVGVPAAVVSAKTPNGERDKLIQRFDRRALLVLINVDLFGEGTDLPDLEVVFMGRPTESFTLFAQQGARASTPVFDGPPPPTREGRLQAIANSAKPYAIVFDHVGNVARHATAVQIDGETIIDIAYGEWSLDARERGSRSSPTDAVPLTSCLNPSCMQVYERALPACPYCGSKPKPASRSAPEFVDGDLTELDPAALATLRHVVVEANKPVEEYERDLVAKHCPPIGIKRNVKLHAQRLEAQDLLRDAMAWWAGHQRAMGRGDAERYKRFWFEFGIDALSAQALGTVEADALREKIEQGIKDHP